MIRTIKINVMKDWAKEDVDPREKGQFIKDFVKDTATSYKLVSERTGIPRSTINDWVRLTEISNVDYEIRKKNGYTSREIIEEVRDIKDSRINKEETACDLDNELENVRGDLQRLLTNMKQRRAGYFSTMHTNEICNKIIDRCRNIQAKVNNYNKKVKDI